MWKKHILTPDNHHITGHPCSLNKVLLIFSMKSISSCFPLLVLVDIFAVDCLLLTATKHRSNYSNPLLNTTPQNTRVKSDSYFSYPSELSSALEGSMPASDSVLRRVPKFFFGLNAATKWIVSVAVTAGVFWNPRHFRGPYIVVGSIAANYMAEILKKIINQGRPEGAPFTDPGMPSSHALVSFFVAMAWNNALGGVGTPWLLGSALTISSLRVLCGYHTVPQIVVGGTLGTLLGHAWMALGALLGKQNHEATFVFSWLAYIVGSAIYIKKNMIKWVTEEKYL